MNNYIVGIDIGSSKVCGSVGKIDKYGKLQILGITSVICSGIKKAEVVDIDNTSEAIRNCVRQLENMVDIEINHVFISLPAGICELVSNKGIIAISAEDKEVKGTDVKRVLEAAQLISVNPDKEIVGIVPIQYIIDGTDSVKDPIGMNCKRLEVDAQIITSETKIITNLFKSFNRVNIKIEGTVLQSLGAAEVLLEKEEMERGVALVDIGADTTTISIFKEGHLSFTEMFYLGGNSITNDIAMVLKIPLAEAERIKIKFGNVIRVSSDKEELIKVSNGVESSIDVKYSVLSEIIEARVEEILSFVYKSLQKSEFYNGISGLVLSGGGISLLNGITEISKEIIGKNVRVGSPKYVGASSPLYSNCIGILKHVSSKTKFNNNVEENFKEPKEDKLKSYSSKSEKGNKGILLKIKNFLGDFF
ncbi:MAG: cell division protein FtsA [Clostridiaceae bacterium]|nr:cell division protein FtsA [Clostridiaceae bacterium]